jgi:hypothetical protein
MILVILAVASFVVASLATAVVLNHVHQTDITNIQKTYIEAIKDAVDDAYLHGYQRCYSHEVTNNKRAGGELTLIMEAIS